MSRKQEQEQEQEHEHEQEQEYYLLIDQGMCDDSPKFRVCQSELKL